MRIACPGCAAAYEVPDGQIRPGRMMQCAMCAQRWPALAAPERLEAPSADLRACGPQTVGPQTVGLQTVGPQTFVHEAAAFDEDADDPAALALAEAADDGLPGVAARPAADPSARLAQELAFHLSSRPVHEAASGPELADQPSGPLGLRRAASLPPAAVVAPRLQLSGLSLPGVARLGIPLRTLLARTGDAAGLGWLASLMAVAGGMAAMAGCRHAVMLAWPPAIRLYAWLGLLPQG